MALAVTALVSAAGACRPAAGASRPPRDRPSSRPSRSKSTTSKSTSLVTDRQGNFVRDLKKEDFQVLRGRQAAGDHRLHARRHPDRARRSAAVRAAADRARRADQRAAVRRPHLRHDPRRSAHALPPHRSACRPRRSSSSSEKLGANDLMAVVHARGAAERRSSQEFTSNKRLLLAAVDKSQGGKLDSATVNKTQRVLPRHARIGQRRRRRTTRRAGARVQRAHDARGNEGRRRLVRRRARPPQDDPAVSAKASTTTSTTSFAQRRDQLGVDGHRRDARRHRGGDAVERQHLRHRSARADRPWRRIDRARQSSAGRRSERRRRPNRAGAAAERAAAGAGQPAHASPKRPAASPSSTRNDFATAFDRIVQDNSSYYVLAYYPPNPKRDGKFHKIEVRVTRPGLTVRARRATRSRREGRRRRCQRPSR